MGEGKKIYAITPSVQNLNYLRETMSLWIVLRQEKKVSCDNNGKYFRIPD